MNENREDIARRILSYLQKNPDAGDTLEGIASTWLQSERIDQSVDDVAEAINSLVKDGVLRIHDINGGRPVYKICTDFSRDSQVQL